MGFAIAIGQYNIARSERRGCRCHKHALNKTVIMLILEARSLMSHIILVLQCDGD